MWHVLQISQTDQELKLDIYIYKHGEPSQKLLENLPDLLLEDTENFVQAETSLIRQTACFRAEGNSLLELQE